MEQMFSSKLLTFRMKLLGIFFFLVLGSTFVQELQSTSISTIIKEHSPLETFSETIQAVIPSLIRRPADVTRLNDAWDASLNVSLQLYKDIQIETFPTAYFVNVFEFKRGLYVSYRTSLASWKTNVASLDDDFKLIGSEFREIVRLEDARLFEFEDDIWFVDNRCCSRQS